MSLNGRTLFVTGGSRGIGLAIADLFASDLDKATLIKYIDRVLTRLTVGGSIYVATICIVPSDWSVHSIFTDSLPSSLPWGE